MDLFLNRPGFGTGAPTERGIWELRSGRPVLVKRHSDYLFVHSLEALEALSEAEKNLFCAPQARLILAFSRLSYLLLPSFVANKRSLGDGGSLPLPEKTYREIIQLATGKEAHYEREIYPLSALEEAALELARLSALLPALYVMPLSEEALSGCSVSFTPLKVESETIVSYRSCAPQQLRIIARAFVPLNGLLKTEFIVFRGGDVLHDHVAIKIGCPDLSQPVFVRLHSSCLTGDVFDSLKCDCGEQLHKTLHHLHNRGGGFLLYLNQEGRGNGLANKMRAYNFQAAGLDTYDADEALGFKDDSRRFDFAAEMLKQLGVKSVRLLTNNPFKIASLEESGLKVVASERIFGSSTDENKNYLISKRDRAGHYIDLSALRPKNTPI